MHDVVVNLVYHVHSLPKGLTIDHCLLITCSDIVVKFIFQVRF